jgi:hypothetical protein
MGGARSRPEWWRLALGQRLTPTVGVPNAHRRLTHALRRGVMPMKPVTITSAR